MSTAPSAPPDAASDGRDPVSGRPDWPIILAVFWFVSMIEGFGVSQIFAFMPQYLTRMGVPHDDRLAFVGIFSALIFVVGAPLVPLWGVWADKYSRKAVIIRSALVEAVVFTAVALSREPWQLALSLLLVGFQLGNTGVMLAAIRDVVPSRLIGTTIGVFAASGPVGFALGPLVGGLLVDVVGLSLEAVFLVSAGLSITTAILVSLTREVRPAVVPVGRVLSLAFGAVRGVITDSTILRIFAIYFVAFLANQMSRPYTPLLVEGLVPAGIGLASAVGFVTGFAALSGAIASPAGGVLGDRVGFRRILIVGLGGGAVALAFSPFAPTVGLLALATLAFQGFNGIVAPMVFALLATEVPDERRSATLNLVYLPLYAAGIIGPAIGAVVASTVGVSGPFLFGAAVLAVSAVSMALASRPQRRRAYRAISK